MARGLRNNRLCVYIVSASALVLLVLLCAAIYLRDAEGVSFEVESVTVRAAEIGEGPHWDHNTQTLYFVDIIEYALHKYVPATGEHNKTTVDRFMSIIIPVEGHPNQFLITQDRDIVVVEWDGTEGGEVRLVQHLAEVDTDVPDNKLNDGKVDSRGRLYVGTTPSNPSEGIPEGKGALFRLDQRGAIKVWPNISLANGLGWSEDDTAMYYIDTMERNLRRYDYDVETGDISNLQYIFDFEEHNVTGHADGMTMDVDGNLWVATFNEVDYGFVMQVSPQGELLRQVFLPVSFVTSCTFGGPNLDILYVTTGFIEFIVPGHPREPLAGRIFKVTGLGVKGQVNNSFKLQS